MVINNSSAPSPSDTPPGSDQPSIPSQLPPPLPPISPIDPEILDAWKKYMKKGFDHNNEMFEKVLDAFIRPYWMTVWMYRLMFFIGIIGFLLAAALGVWKGWEFSAVFGGLSVISFLTYFISRPLQSLEQNIMLITWLGMIYNTYWTRLMYTHDLETVQSELEQITQTAIHDINCLIDKQSELAGKRPAINQVEPTP